VFKRGGAPLKHLSSPFQGEKYKKLESQRGEASLLQIPLPLDKGKGDKGDRVFMNHKGVRLEISNRRFV